MRDVITYFHRRLLGLGPVRLRSAQNVIELKNSLSNSFYEAEIYEEDEILYAKWVAGDILFRILFWFVCFTRWLGVFAGVGYGWGDSISRNGEGAVCARPPSRNMTA